ncbi:MAG: fibronectin type III domain-containing protein, partial [Confluentibacter sp.]|nr:fibronectin type III domain-containing protein [Confluentibacter sp.]
TLSIYSQNSSKEKAEKYLAAKGELTFSFKVNNSQEIDSFTNDLSIENYDPETKTVFAWANEKQFRLFESKNIPFDIPENENEVDEKLIYDNNANVAKSNASKASLANTLSFPVSTYPTYAQYAQQMQDFANNYPALVQKISIGATGKNDGKELLLVKISDNVSVDEKEPKLLLTSSIHGDEIAGYPMMLSLIDYILTVYSNPLHADHARIKNLVENSEIWINPSANPDGTYYGSASNTSVTNARRGNNNGIDLNRNYPDNVAGAHPDGNAYQVETLAFMNLANTHHFVLSANFHGGIEVVNYPFDNAYANVALHPDNSWFEYVSVQYATHAQNDSNPFGDTTYMTIDYDSALYPSPGVTRGAEWYRVFGGRQDYMNFYKQCKEITIELSDTKLLPTSQLVNYWIYNKNALLDFLTQGTYGFRGIVKDAITGTPIDAKVTIVGHDAYGSHTFTDISHGDYYRPIKAGTYSILFEADCYQSYTLTNQTISDFQTKVLADVSLTPIASAVPTSLAATSITFNSASLGWSSSSGNTFDLRYRVVGSPIWIDVLGLSSSPYSLSGLTASTNYEFQVRSICASSTSAYSSSKNFSTTAITYCTSNSTNSNRGYIGNVTFGTINKTTGYGTGGYSDFTSTSTDVTIGSAYNISVTKTWPGTKYNEAIRVWIDYNKDGDFDDTGERIMNSAASQTTPITGNITIPVTATTGSTRMRVSLGTTVPSNCGSFTYGEVEDYTINILPSCIQPAPPTIACYETATFDTNTCAWVVTGTQPAQPALACYESATFDTNTCAWVVTGTQPVQPALACYETATFNTGTCSWDVTGTQPAQPALACYQTA